MRVESRKRRDQASRIALDAIDLILEWSNGKTFTDYQADTLPRSAIERQFEVVGEALTVADRHDTTLRDVVPQIGDIIETGAALTRVYPRVDDSTVGTAITGSLSATETGLVPFVGQQARIMNR